MIIEYDPHCFNMALATIEWHNARRGNLPEIPNTVAPVLALVAWEHSNLCLSAIAGAMDAKLRKLEYIP